LKDQAGFIDNRGFLVYVVSIDTPEIVIAVQRYLFCGQNSHKQTVILVIVFKGSTTPNYMKTGDCLQIVLYYVNVIPVSDAVNRIAEWNSHDVSIQDTGALDQARFAKIGARLFNMAAIRFMPTQIIRIAPQFKGQDRIATVSIELWDPVSEICNSAQRKLRRMDVDPLVREKSRRFHAKIHNNCAAKTQA